MFAIVGFMVLGACGGSRLTLSEYSTEVSALVGALDSRLDAEGAAYFSGPASVEGAREYLAIRVDGYRNAVEGIEAINPPEEVEDLHDTFAEILGSILAAEEARAAVGDSIDSVEELPRVWDGPESDAVRAAEEDAIVLCYAAQAHFDATEQRDAFTEVPWMPGELKEVIRVALDCP